MSIDLYTRTRTQHEGRSSRSIEMQTQRTNNLVRDKRNDIPDGTWVKCSECGEIIYSGELSRNLRICPKCDYYFPLEPAERIDLLVDRGSFLKYNADCQCPTDLDEESYDRAIMTGEAALAGHRLVIAAIDLNLIDVPTNGLFVCEKIIRAIDRAVDQHLPLLMVCTNGAEAQLQNGTFFPAQMLSTSAAISGLTGEKLLYISVLTHSNSHGNFPGFAYIADIVIVESNMPESSRPGNKTEQNGTTQAAQTLFQNGMVDMIVSRRESKQALTDILNFFC